MNGCSQDWNATTSEAGADATAEQSDGSASNDAESLGCEGGCEQLDAGTGDASLTDGGALDAQTNADSEVSSEGGTSPDANDCPAGQIAGPAGQCIVDPCKADSCTHGTCAGSSGAAVCNCVGSGYAGSKCEVDIDECASAPCAARYQCLQTEAPGYTCRGQLADWPMPDKTPGAKASPSYELRDGVIVDKVTGLWWQNRLPAEVAGDATYASCFNSAGSPATRCAWDHARAYCDGLLLGNRSDWRLPTIIESISITEGASLPDVFNATMRAALAWTGSPVGGSTTAAWLFGGAGAFDLKLDFHVRCVAGGALPQSGPRYRVDTGANVVEDRRTGLIWQRTIDQTQRSRSDAIVACSGAGWRLPTSKELATLIVYDMTADTEGLMDRDAFPKVPGTMFWGVDELQPGRGFAIDFASGARGAIDSTAKASVRCVR